MSRKASKESGRIVVVGHDIGGAQAVLPVARALKRKGDISVSAVAGPFAWKTFGSLRPEMTQEDWPDERIDSYLREKRPGLLLTSTSWKSRLEQGFRNRALAMGIPSVVILDFWSNYRLRWQHADYSFDAGVDEVCVMDRAAAQAMIGFGYPPERIHVTGQPHLESCAAHDVAAKKRKQAVSKLRILFLSTPFAAMGVTQDATAPFRIIFEGMGKWARTAKMPVVLSIRQHPHEKSDAGFLDQLREIAPEFLHIRIVARSAPLRRQINSHDMVMGYLTMALFEAVCLGKDALAIRITDYPMELQAAMRACGLRIAAFTGSSIAAGLRNRRAGTDSRRLYKGATEKAVAVCRRILAGKNK